MELKDLINKSGITSSDEQIEDFEMWTTNELWNKYKEYRMNKRLVVENEMSVLGIRLPNGTANKSYRAEIEIPDNMTSDRWFEGLEELGLDATLAEDGKTHIISGCPSQPGDFSVYLKYKYKDWIEGEEISSLKIPVAFNPDPRSLWKNIPTSENVSFYKPDSCCEYVKVTGADGCPRKDIVAASQRGRSHAQEGKPRDDHFSLFYCEKSEWYVIAVADGAGSAKYSRKGSEIACETVVKYCKEKLADCPDFEQRIKDYNSAEDEATARKIIGDSIYEIVANAAFKAHRAINECAAANDNMVPKDFATTLMFAICKKFDFGWAIASFWVGDGAMCLFNKENKSFKLLGVPDEGEYSGQTRFLTMPEIFKDAASIYARLRFSIEKDFTALMLMTDGVSDPMFETDQKLNSYEKWEELWDKLKNGFPEDKIGGVDLSDDNEGAKDQMLGWLDFWSAGNHDDRTIAILY